MMGLGVQELIIIGVIAVLLFGGKKVGELGKGVGDSIREFKKAIRQTDGIKKDIAE